MMEWNRVTGKEKTTEHDAATSRTFGKLFLRWGKHKL